MHGLILLGDLHLGRIDDNLSQIHGVDDFAVEPDALHDLTERIVEGKRFHPIVVPRPWPAYGNYAGASPPVRGSIRARLVYFGPNAASRLLSSDKWGEEA
jgi:hypothetical protein